MSHDELKEKGNECIRQKNYKNAALYYTSALSKDPCSHIVFSNRSLAHSKLQQFESALGYLRKSVALTGLGENSKHWLLQNKATSWEASKLCGTMVGSEWLPTQTKSWLLPTRNWSSTRRHTIDYLWSYQEAVEYSQTTTSPSSWIYFCVNCSSPQLVVSLLLALVNSLRSSIAFCSSLDMCRPVHTQCYG